MRQVREFFGGEIDRYGGLLNGRNRDGDGKNMQYAIQYIPLIRETVFSDEKLPNNRDGLIFEHYHFSWQLASIVEHMPRDDLLNQCAL